MNCIILKDGISQKDIDALRKKERDALPINDWGKKTAWLGRRSVEVLAYQKNEKCVNILFNVFIENMLRNGTPNSLEILHPGNVTLKPVGSWPPPCHLNEPDSHKNGKKDNILMSIYKRAFKYESELKTLYQTSGLSVWDSWYGCEDEQVVFWTNKDIVSRNAFSIAMPSPQASGNEFVPFSVFRLEGFTESGPTIISFELTIKNETYAKLVGQDPVFTINGPETLLLRIKRKYLDAVQDADKEQWEKRLAEFQQYIGFGESYDVILLKKPYPDELECVWKSGIVKAPIQPPSEVAVRYITAYPRFTLALKYSAVEQETSGKKTKAGVN